MKRERITEIAEILDKRGKLTLEQLEEYFPNVSQMTLRRDLFQLEEEGKIIRVRGGAMSVREVQKTSGEPYTKKTTMHTDEKIVIAQKAAELIDEGATLFLDGGTTALYLAKEMPDRPYNVLTNGLAVATELAKKKNVVVNLLGGQLIKENLATASAFSSLYFTDTNFEIAIISAAAFTLENGFSCSSQVEAELLRVVCKKAKFLYMMLDSSKIGKIKPYTFARAEDINVLITDDVFPEGLKDDFKAKNQGEFYYCSTKGQKCHSDVTYPSDKDIYFVFGKESHGLPEPLLKDNYDRCIRIPMLGFVRSLNLSNSVAVIVYEALRQMNYPDLTNQGQLTGRLD